MTLRPALSLLLIWMTLVAVLPSTGAQTVTNQDSGTTGPDGLHLRLSEEKETVQTPPSNQNSGITMLPAAQTKKLLARLPALKPEPGDRQNFKLRERSLPPPRTGETIQAPFGVSTTDAPVASITNSPLEVIRFAPDGEVALAPNLSITFSQPMVAVASQAEAAANVPVILTPQPLGKWRWLGTQTLMFQPDAEGGRLPMATSYTVTVPAGTKSALGNSLRETKTLTFGTPPLQLKSSYPEGEGKPRDTLLFLEFDQRIEPARVLDRLRLQSANADARLRLATAEEIAADSLISDLIKRSLEGRWIVVRAVDSNGGTKDALPSDTVIKVVIPSGTPSAEGARTTVAEQSFTFKTYGPMRVINTQCGLPCSQFDSFRIDFNNQPDLQAFQTAQIKITPEIPNVRITGYYNGIMIDGTKRSNTTYTVTLSRAIKDIFGQTLTGNNELTFKVTTGYPGLFGPGGDFMVLEPAGPRAYTIFSVNHTRLRVVLHKVTVDDWSQFQRYMGGRYNNPKEIPALPGKLVSDKIIEINADPDQLIESTIDLSPALEDGYGHVFVKVEPVESEKIKDEPVNVFSNRRNIAEAWVQSTEIGLDAFADRSSLVVWTNSLKDGRPLAGVELNILPDDLTGPTEANGLAVFPFKDPAKAIQQAPSLIVARRGKDVAILSQDYSSYPNSSDRRSWRNTRADGEVIWYVFDDRNLYRPGEEVNIKGWVRQLSLTPTGDVEMYTSDPEETLNYVLKDSLENEITKGSVKINALAGFNLKVKLPPTMHLGDASVQFRFGDDGWGHDHRFKVQEFRRPEFEITTQISDGPHFVGSGATAALKAAYYSGGGLADTEVDWSVQSRLTNYTPPNRDDYTFGKFHPWWFYDQDYGATNEQSFKGRTDRDGKHTLRMDFDGVRPARPSSVTVSARVQDVNRQTISAYSYFLVHPADIYVGVKSTRSFVQKGEAFDISTIVTDLEGKAISGREVRLRLFGEIEQEQIVKSGVDAVHSRFQTTAGGVYYLIAQVRDDRGRLNESELSLWVAGGKLTPAREVTQEKVELIPDRRTYGDNDVAEILVRSPFAPAEGVLTIRRSGLLRTERFTMTENSYTLRVPIAEAMTPNLQVQVDLVGAAVRLDDAGNELGHLPKRSAFASGEIKLDIPPVMRRLSVTATPRDKVLEPGAETVVDVEVKDAHGQGVPGTDTAVIVVDESVLTVANYQPLDPLRIFYPERDESVNDYHLREKVRLANAADVQRIATGIDLEPRAIRSLPLNGRNFESLLPLMNQLYALETVSVTDSGAQGPIATRKNFDALAVFAASLPTDAQGRAQVKVKLPDNLTRYRVMAVSVAGGKLAGSGESAITARKRLMARPSAPRFLNYGDTAELPVVLQNQTDEALDVSVAVRASNADVTGSAGRRVTVPANNRVEVRFPIATVKPGTARFQIVAASGERADAAEISLPVYTPATTEAFATYGVVENSITQPVKAPADAIKTFGGLEITTASTQLQELTDAFIYLVEYPYECTEQKASRIIAIAALKDVIAAFKLGDMPDLESLRASVDSQLKFLQGLQQSDGGFGFWSLEEPSFPYVSIHVAHALVRAKGKGFAVPESMLEKSQNYLRRIDEKIPKEYSIEARRAIQAYALYVRYLMGDVDSARARKLIEDAGGVEKLSLESLGWLLPVVSGDEGSAKETEAIRRHLNNRVTETAGAAHFADSYSDGAYTMLNSNRRADGVILEALIRDQPKSDLIPKLVRGLLSGRERGHWLNTQENAFIILALDRYFNTYERTTPDFVARVWLGNGYAGEQVFKGRSIDRRQLNLPMSEFAERTASGPANLTIAKEGAGRLYFRIGAQYAPANLKIAAADYGFEVERNYEAVDDPADVQRDPDGGWLIKAGARVRVRLTMSNPARRYHVALVDPLPAGLEPLNPELATTERLPAGSGGPAINDYWYWHRIWYEHQNLRDDRVEAFTTLLWEGVHEYTYFARATTPGLFVVPPPKAEEMYAPETFGRGHTDRVRIK